MIKWIRIGVLASTAAVIMSSIPLAAVAECQMGVFGGRVCTSDPVATSGKTYYKKANPNKQFRYTNQPYHPRPKPQFPSTMQTGGVSTFVFDPKQVAWAAYAPDGDLVKMGPASGGKAYCPDIGKPCRTPAGKYAVYRKGSQACKSSKYPIGKGGAPMPYCMFFHGGYAIHGSGHVPAYNASHGCIRVLPVHSKWLSQNFIKNGTQVIVLPY